MSSQLCLSVTFLNPYFHGRRDGNVLEWPPSPLRLFQSMVSAVAAGQRLEHTRGALQWLEEQPVPTIVAPIGEAAGGYRLSVPNNAMDVVTRAWARGNESGQGDANPATHRTMKTVRYTRLIDDDEFPAAHYLWNLPDAPPEAVERHLEVLSAASRLAVALGWGVDMIAGHGLVLSREQADCLRGERWEPLNGTNAVPLRVPVKGTLLELEKRHEAWLNRLSDAGGTFTPTPPLSAFETAGYSRTADLSARHFAAFSFRKPESGGFHTFSSSRQTSVVAGMVRHATKLACERTGWPQAKIDAFVLGHGESKGSAEHIAVGPARFAYLPIPSIESRGNNVAHVVGDIRRVVLYSFEEGRRDEIEWSKGALSGQDLISEEQRAPAALIALIPEPDGVILRYTRRAASWATVTPVILPGYDDPAHYRRRLKHTMSSQEQVKLLSRLDSRIDGLLRRAILQAGLPQTLAKHAEIEWRTVGFWRGTERADHYRVPNHLQRYPRVHVKMHWRDEYGRPVEVPGPICFGGGRFCGMGLFAAL